MKSMTPFVHLLIRHAQPPLILTYFDEIVEMNVLIVDDEYKAREILELVIKVHVPEITQLRMAASGHEASAILEDFQPEIVFLDIKMPGMNGFEWLASLTDRSFDVIFVTAYDQYAIQAIRFSAFDYLLKPVDPEDMRSTIDRYQKDPSSRRNSFDNLLYNVAQEDAGNFKLAIATTGSTHYLESKVIMRCEADGNYTHFYLSTDKHILASRPIGHFSALLPDTQFIRCHKSHLVNRQYITSITHNKVQLNDGSIVDISRRRMAAVKAFMLK